MQAVLTNEKVISARINEVMAELHDFVSNIQKPNFKDDKWKTSMLEFCDELTVKMNEIHQVLSEKREEYSGSLEEISLQLKDYAEELKTRPNVKKLQNLYGRLSSNYEELVVHLQDLKMAGLQKVTHHTHLKPTNYARSIFHMIMGLTGVLMYQFVLTKTQAVWILGTLAVTFVSLEISRRFSKRWNDFLVDKAFGIIARPFERHRTVGATWYLAALGLITPFFPKPAVLIAVLILGFSDPMASIIGKRFGSKKLFHDKSYAGTIAFFVTGVLVSMLYLGLAMPQVSFALALLLSALIALTGTITELFSSRIDDNFSIPVACTVAGSILLWIGNVV